MVIPISSTSTMLVKTLTFNSLKIVDTQYTLTTSLPDQSYYWSVSAQDATTPAMDYSVLRAFTVDTTGPAAPTLSFPTVATVSGVPTFKWSTVSGAKTYRFAYDEDSVAAPYEFTSASLTKTQYLPANLPFNKIIFWTVQAADSLGNWGPWSAPRQLWVDPLIPAAPKLLSPQNNKVLSDNTPNLSWNSVLYADQYQIEVARDPKFLIVINNPDLLLSGPSYDSGALNEWKFYWHVRAINADHQAGPYSGAFAFTIDMTPPGNPALLSPAYGSSSAGNPTFTWSAPATAKTYEFQYSSNDTFTSPVSSGFLTKTSYKPAVPMPAGDWYWRVFAYDAYGNESDYNMPRLVHILPATPGQVTLTTPASGYYTSTGTIDLSWNPVAYAVQYELQVDDLSSFATPNISTTSAGTTKNVEIFGLDSGDTKWYWRVRAVNSNGIPGKWSTARYFTKSGFDLYHFTNVSELVSFSPHPGAGWGVTSGYLYNDGIPNSMNSSSISYPHTLTNFSLNTRLKIENSSVEDYKSYYGVIVRGTPEPTHSLTTGLKVTIF